MRTIKAGLLVIALMLVYGCSHPIDIVGEGDVISASGTRNCSLEDEQADLAKCRENLVYGKYSETYTAAARPNWQFRRWGNYCGTALTNECSFNVPAATVKSFWGQTLPPLQAVFRSTNNTGFTALFMGDSFFEPFASGILDYAVAAGFSDHGSTIFPGQNDQGAPQVFWDNASQRADIQAELNTGTIELLGMTYDPNYPNVNGYKNWVKYALSKNPDTRFFIAVPWSMDPANHSSAQYAANYELLHAQVHALIDALRAAYPGVDFYCIPSGQSAVELYNLYSAGNLPDVSALVGDGAESVFSDSVGHAGDMLVALGELVWLGAIYEVDLSSYSFDSGFSTDLKAIASSILEGHEAKYNAPAEVDIDTDGDGIWDRLDPNPTGKPNILLILADDLGYNDLAINNDNTEIDTPNMDQIARDGVRFTRHYASAVCSPARAALLTGIYPERLGYLPNGRGISPEVVTLPERLKAEGYTTWHIGKWHIGDLERTAWPDHQGFDHWFGFLNQWRLAGLHTVNGDLELSDPTYQNPWLESDSAPGKQYTGHLENILTDKAIGVLSDLNRAQAPWFLNLWYMAPHSPVQPASEFAQNYPNTTAGKYQALVNQLDHNIGRIISHLDTLGTLQNTIIIVMSDNGGTNDALNNNAPFRGKKTTLTEGGLRTPLIIRWPDESINGQVFSDVVSIEDIYPSLLASIGVAPPENLDGNNFYQSLQQLEPATVKARFWDHMMTKDWVSYAALSADGLWRFYQPGPVWGVTPEPILNDLALDPTGTQKVVPIPPAQLMQFTESYQAWYREVHTVKTAYVPGANGSGTLTGMGFLRTPGFGTYTFGIGVADAYDGQIVAQAGIWSMHRTGNTVTAQFGDLILSGDIQNSNSCHSIVISGNFSRKIQSSSGPELMTLALYIDGIQTQSSEVPGVLGVVDPAIETIIGDPGISTGAEAMLPPVILNTALNDSSPWPLASFSQELCNNN